MAKRSVKNKVEALFNPDLVPVNHAGGADLNDKALKHVSHLLDTYTSMRIITQGGLYIDIVERWDELYRIYKAAYNRSDHNYDGVADCMFPVARRTVNIIESEASNALFSRADYFSVEGVGDDASNHDMARRAFNVLRYYSDENNYVDQYELAIKQCLIYGVTVVENILQKDQYEGVYRKLIETPQINEQTGQPKIHLLTRKPITKKEYKIVQEKGIIERPRVEVRDIYRLYINMFADDPEQDDMIYVDEMSSQTLILAAEQGVYNKDAVAELIKMPPSAQAKDMQRNGGQGKTMVAEASKQDAVTAKYEILRFQGLFTIEDETSGELLQKQFWIDIGERKHVLRIQENPILGGFKTFSLCNYDSMISEYYTDGVIDPIKSIQYQIDDKENQSLDGLSFDLNAPWLMNKGAGIKQSDVEDSREVPHKVIPTRDMNALKKMVNPINLAHLNAELIRLNQYVDNVTGAVASTAGIPTGTQADRSGKALGILQGQARNQFSKFVRKLERRLIQRSLRKVWQMITQFVDDQIEIELLGDNNTATPFKQNVAEIVGQFNIQVSGGSEYLKERETRDSILEFFSILGMSDAFMATADLVPMLQDVAKSSPRDMSKYIKPDNLYQKQKQQIDQLNQMVQQMQQQVQQATKAMKNVNQATPPAPVASPDTSQPATGTPSDTTSGAATPMSMMGLMQGSDANGQ